MTTTNPPPPETQDPETLTPHQQAERRAAVVRLKDSGKSFAEVGKLLGIARPTAHREYWKAVAAAPQQAVSEMRANQNARLEWLMQQAIEVAESTHYAHSGGTLVYGPRAEGADNGVIEPLLDTGPKLAAIREIRALVEAQAKLNGTNAPAQVTVNGQVSFVINNVDMGNLS